MRFSPLLLFFPALAISLMSCGSSRKLYSTRAHYSSYDYQAYQNVETSIEPGEAADDEGKMVREQNLPLLPQVQEQDKIMVYNADAKLKVKNPDSAANRLEDMAGSMGGYVVNKSNFSVSLRIPSARLEEAMKKLSDYGKVMEKSISAENIFGQYYDMQIRLDNAIAARKRYLELLAKAENVEAALKVEKELERLNREIDLYQAQMNRMNQDIAYSQLYVRLQERKILGPLGLIFSGLGHLVKFLFVIN